MTRTNFNSLAGQLTQQVQQAMDKEIKFFLIPVWLDDTLQAHSLSETILSDSNKLNSILTEDDIKFYNQTLCELYRIMPSLPIAKDIKLGQLLTNQYGYSEYAGPLPPSYEENSIGKKELLTPFIKEAHSVSVDKLWNIVASYSVNKLSDHTLVGIRLNIVPFEDVLPLQLKQDEKLAELFIEEKGLMNTAGTHLFKKILEFKSCY